MSRVLFVTLWNCYPRLFWKAKINKFGLVYVWVSHEMRKYLNYKDDLRHVQVSLDIDVYHWWCRKVNGINKWPCYSSDLNRMIELKNLDLFSSHCYVNHITHLRTISNVVDSHGDGEDVMLTENYIPPPIHVGINHI